MPFTPFHFGLGLGFKGLARPVFSWSAFVLAQVLIDCETLYYLLNHEYPVHRVLHSFLGATAVGLVAAGLWLLVVRGVTAVQPGVMSRIRASPFRSEFSFVAVMWGGFVGGLSHPLFDGIMHPDVRPFMPFSDANPFLGLIGIGALHLTCVVAGVLGLVVVGFWSRGADEAG
jgi:hypothetical protein